jgi:hypothetical protein
MAAQVLKALKVAQANLGDLLRDVTLKRKTGEVYANGTYTPTEVDVSAKMAIDAFSYQEKESGLFKETDVKASIFNNDAGDLVVTTDDHIVLDGIRYSVYRVNPAYVGGIVAVYEVILRR